MKLNLGKRSHVSRGGRLVAGLALVLLGAAAVFQSGQPGPAAWIIAGVALAGLLALVLWRAEDREQLEQEELIEVARESIRAETERLGRRRLEIEKVLMAYAEWMEFPDFDELREVEWAVAGKSAQDAEVADLLNLEADRVLEKVSGGEYWEGRQFQTRIMLLDLFSFVESIAKVYRPDSEKPLLETNLESLLKAVNRASLQIILLLEEVPLIDVKDLNLRKFSDQVRKAGTVFRKYEQIRPYLEPVRYLWQGGKFLIASNPLLAAGWIAGAELFWRGSRKYGKKAIDAYLLSLVRQSLGIVAWETASIYDRTHRYRNPDLVYGVELAHLVSQFPLSRDTLRQALKELGTIPLRSSYDRVFLYRCVAQHVSPKPENFAQADLLSDETRHQLLERLEVFFSKFVDSAPDRKRAKWRAGLLKRLGISSQPPGA